MPGQMAGAHQLPQVSHWAGTEDAPQTLHGVQEGFPSLEQLRDTGTLRAPPTSKMIARLQDFSVTLKRSREGPCDLS